MRVELREVRRAQIELPGGRCRRLFAGLVFREGAGAERQTRRDQGGNACTHEPGSDVASFDVHVRLALST